MTPIKFSRRELGKATGIAVFLNAAAGAAQRGAAGHIDTAWFREMVTQDVERSLRTIVTPSGFLGNVNAGSKKGGPPAPAPGAYRPTGLGMGSPTGQGRNMFVLAAGYDLTKKQEFLDATVKAADFMLSAYRDKQYGGLYAAVDPSGKVIDDRKESYGTAHAILGMSHAARVTGRKAYGDAALEIWSDMKKGLRDQYGLFKRETSRDFKTQGPGKNTQNPMMHLFEALLALYDATKSKTVFQDAQAHADNVMQRLFREQGGYLPEVYDQAWKPIPAGAPGQTEPDGSPIDVYNAYSAAAQTGHVEVGHQVEWAFFLSRAVELGFPARYLKQGEKFLAYSLKVGFDPKTGAFFGYADYDGKPTAASAASGWQICEWIKMIAHWAVLRDRRDLWEPFDKSVAALKGGTPPGGYHGDGMYVEVLRMAGRGV